MKLNSYYLEHENDYVSGFAEVMKEVSDHELTNDEAKQYFKEYMFDEKNIKVDFRQKFWRIVFNKGMKQAGYFFMVFRGLL